MPFQQQIPREPVLRLLRTTNLSETAIAQQLGISRPTVHKIRKDHGLPSPLCGSVPKHASVDDAYHALAQPGADGHAIWTGPRNGSTPIIERQHTCYSAYKVAFRIHHGREPEGLVRPACGTPYCVAGAHLTDRAIRKAAAAARVKKQPGPRAAASRQEIAALLGEGRSDKDIARTLGTSSERVQKVRRDLGLPVWRHNSLPIEEKFKAWARPTRGGHARWTGPVRGTTPSIPHARRNHSARAVGLAALHGRPAEGRVLPGCGLVWCVAPEHAVDDVIRRADRLFDRIFGRAA